MARTNAEMTEGTRRRLLDAAMDMFATSGFRGVSADDIAASADLTRGALTYQFTNKKGLFRAVYAKLVEQLGALIVVQVEAQTGDPVQRLIKGADMMLDAADTPAVRRIILEDGPSVLGMDVCRDILSDVALASLARPFQVLAAGNRFDPQDIAPVAHLIFGALLQASADIAASDDPEQVRKRYSVLMHRFIEGFVKDM